MLARIMKTIRLRAIRVVGALIAGSLVFLVVVKSNVDTHHADQTSAFHPNEPALRENFESPAGVANAKDRHHRPHERHVEPQPPDARPLVDNNQHGAFHPNQEPPDAAAGRKVGYYRRNSGEAGGAEGGSPERNGGGRPGGVIRPPAVNPPGNDDGLGKPLHGVNPVIDDIDRNMRAGVHPPAGGVDAAEHGGVDSNNALVHQKRQGAGKQSILARSSSKGYPTLKNGKFIPMRRIVHFDLKGAAPRVDYIIAVFGLLKKLGATGVLLEYEDVFPFEGSLAPVRSTTAYTKGDLRRILAAAKSNNLEVIPLVQTFGHLEYILKYPQFMHLREADRFPQTLCPSNEEAVGLVKDSIDQVLAMHPDINYFHIGADETFQVGMCDKCQQEIAKLNGMREGLIVRHMQRIAQYVKDKNPNVKVMIWHDMINNVEPELLKEYRLGELVEPVVWAYAENLDDFLQPDMWQRFASVFPNIWGASAYKGADGPARFYSNVPHYLQNHLSWVGQMTQNYREFGGEFSGLIFTGWQRYDHFAILCELLPVGLPSLAVNLLTIQNGEYTRRLVSQASDQLSCSSQLDTENTGATPYCDFPGGKVYQMVQQLKYLQDTIREQVYADYQLQGWLSRFNTAHNYSQAWYLDQILEKVTFHLDDLKALRANLRAQLQAIYQDDTVQEFLLEHLDEDLKKLTDIVDSAKRLGGLKTFARRPFPIVNDYLPKSKKKSDKKRDFGAAPANQHDGV